MWNDGQESLPRGRTQGPLRLRQALLSTMNGDFVEKESDKGWRRLVLKEIRRGDVHLRQLRRLISGALGRQRPTRAGGSLQLWLT